MRDNALKAKRRLSLLLLGILSMSLGCQQTRLNGVDRFLKHPQFQAAAKAAPQFTQEVLNKLAEYEYELERR